MDQALQKELTAIRDMVMQNRQVLDVLTAAQGGVCTLIGTCCTFIPDETGTDGDTAAAIHKLTMLRDYLE